MERKLWAGSGAGELELGWAGGGWCECYEDVYGSWGGHCFGALGWPYLYWGFTVLELDFCGINSDTILDNSESRKWCRSRAERGEQLRIGAERLGLVAADMGIDPCQYWGSVVDMDGLRHTWYNHGSLNAHYFV